MNIDNYCEEILQRKKTKRYGLMGYCNECGKSWYTEKQDMIETMDLRYNKLICPYCRSVQKIPRYYFEKN